MQLNYSKTQQNMLFLTIYLADIIFKKRAKNFCFKV
jgi:hypothetical protein